MRKIDYSQQFIPSEQETSSDFKLKNGSRVAVVGGGPAGALFSYFLLELAERVDLTIKVDIYEPKNFALSGPPGCNMCAGIVSESLIQMLVVEGINLPPTVVQRGVDTYILHTNVGNVSFETPELEKRIGAVFRGAGPLGVKDSEWSSFDGYLLGQAIQKGAHLIPARVEAVEHLDGRLQVSGRGAATQCYDLLAVAAGVNTAALKLFQPLEPQFQPPEVVQTFVREYFFGKETIEGNFGQHNIHFFLLDLPGVDFAAIVPKGNYVTVCLLGEDLSKNVIDDFMNAPEVRSCMPSGWQPESFVCHCSPRINLSGAVHPYADRLVILGDSGVSRLYKDGIGAAYRAAKYAATTAIFYGVSAEDFEQHYWQMCRRMESDNHIGKFIFAIVRRIKPLRFAMRGLVRMVETEQTKEANQRRLSRIMWDMFTGSAPYRDIFYRFFHPAFWSRFLISVGASLVRRA